MFKKVLKSIVSGIREKNVTLHKVIIVKESFKFQVTENFIFKFLNSFNIEKRIKINYL